MNDGNRSTARLNLKNVGSLKEAQILDKFRRLLARMRKPDRRLLLQMAQKMARH
jgi:hypothetical protein